MTLNNFDRAELARGAVYDFMMECGMSKEREGDGTQDLLADLAHLIRLDGGDPLVAFSRALGVFLAEEFDEDGIAPEPNVSISWERPDSWGPAI